MIGESVAPPSRPPCAEQRCTGCVLGLAAGGGGTGESPVKLPIAVAKAERRARQIKEVNLGIIPKFEALITRVTAPHFMGFICEDNYVVK